jgi:hypothetical protein
MKRNKKSQVRGLHLDGKTNQYVHRREMSEDVPPSTQRPLGDAKNVEKYEEMEEQRVKRK